MLVEDDLLLLKVIGFQLKEAEIDFRAASEGHEALNLIRLHRPDVLILDLTIPGLNGFEIVKALHDDPSFIEPQGFTVIVYSSLDVSQVERQALSVLGKTVFYTKSINDQDMGKVVKQLLAEA